MQPGMPSTEPHSLECGEKKFPCPARPSQKSLQRSRTRWSAERGEEVARKIADLQPSTEPHSLECGETSVDAYIFQHWFLQRSRTRWSAERLLSGSVGLQMRSLQRSRTRWSAERLLSGSVGLQMRSLQRSRTRWSAESSLAPVATSGGMLAFNGAALVGVRRAVFPTKAVFQTDVPSTEPHSLECGERMGPGCRNYAAGILQRSRTRWSAESIAESEDAEPQYFPSTEPHSLECGEVNRLGPILLRRQPSLQRSRTRWSAESIM